MPLAVAGAQATKFASQRPAVSALQVDAVIGSNPCDVPTVPLNAEVASSESVGSNGAAGGTETANGKYGSAALPPQEAFT